MGVDSRPIGVFDSGFGGLTVTRALLDLLPEEQLVYVGDTGRYPYGSKPLDEVRGYANEITSWFVDEHDVKLVIVACNTATAAALGELQARFDTPIVGVIDSGVRSLISASTTHRIGVIGTVGTIGSGAYQGAVADIDSSVELTCAACPGFVEFVERGDLESDQVHVLAQPARTDRRGQGRFAAAWLHALPLPGSHDYRRARSRSGARVISRRNRVRCP